MKVYRLSKDARGLWRINGRSSRIIEDFVRSHGIADYISTIGGRVSQIDSPLFCSCGNPFPHTGVVILCDGDYELVVEDV